MKRFLALFLVLSLSTQSACIFFGEDETPPKKPIPAKDMGSDLVSDMGQDSTPDMVVGPDMNMCTVDSNNAALKCCGGPTPIDTSQDADNCGMCGVQCADNGSCTSVSYTHLTLPTTPYV